METSQAEMTPETREWHKKLAMQCNNRAWALAERARSDAENREMLTAAHTSAFHWALIGTELHRMRATMLLAEVHALLGHGATALALATQMRDFFLARDDTPDWEVAFTHAIYAHSAHAAGDLAAHRAAYQDAVAAIAAIADQEDCDIVARTFGHVPVP